MAWGDIRYDHSDIFDGKIGGSSVRQTTRPESWDKVVRFIKANGPSTAVEVGKHMGHGCPRTTTATLLNAMAKQGVLTKRRRLVPGKAGMTPYEFLTK